jgi:signal transduction histidine kinase
MTDDIEQKVRSLQSSYSPLPVPWDSFSPIYQKAVSTYRMIFAVRKMQISTEMLDPLSDSGNRVNLEMMLKDSPEIPDSDYLLQPEEDLRMELNRLRIIGSIYDMIFKKISGIAIDFRMKCRDIEKEDEYDAISAHRISEFLSSISAIEYEALTGKNMLLEGLARRYQNQAKLNDIIGSIAVVMDAFYKQDKIELEIIMSDRDMVVEGNPHDIKQALMNILMAKSYALRHTEKARVTIGSGVNGSYAVIYIVDNGPQIPHEDANMIFHVAENATAIGWKYDIALAERQIVSSHGFVQAKNMDVGVEEKIILPGFNN